jgi:hypothetical protein
MPNGYSQQVTTSKEMYPVLVKYDIASLGNRLATFRKNSVPPSSMLNNSHCSRNSVLLKTDAIFYIETSESDWPATKRHITHNSGVSATSLGDIQNLSVKKCIHTAYTFGALYQRFPNCAPRVARDPRPAPRVSVDTFM